MPNKIADNEIKRMLECCGRSICVECELTDQCNGFTPITLALSLINRQKAEIERLQKQIVFEVERAYDRGKNAGVKEFAERLKAESVYLDIDRDCFICTAIGQWKTWGTVGEWCEETIDKIYKEMVGEDK